MEQVNHPQHYTQHPAGIECIDVVRHYTFDIGCAIKYLWRAGLKKEMGKEDADKEIEDLRKAIWYINDFRTKEVSVTRTDKLPSICHMFREVTDYTMQSVVAPYSDDIAVSLRFLFCVGLQWCGSVWVTSGWQTKLQNAIESIQKRIQDIEESQRSKTMDLEG